MKGKFTSFKCAMKAVCSHVGKYCFRIDISEVQNMMVTSKCEYVCLPEGKELIA